MQSLTFSTRDFSGPLDLLLGLIQDRKLSITEIGLSEVTEQYLSHVEELEVVDPDSIADFLVVAAKLLLLKSQSLLPQIFPDEEDGPSLEEQLRVYKRFVEASKHIQDRWMSEARARFRIEPPRKRSEEFLPPSNFNLEALGGSMVQLLGRLKPPKALPTTTIDRRITLKQTIAKIRTLLKKQKEISFNATMGEAANKTELIVNFLAILELARKKDVALKQQEQFSDILISRT